MTTTLAITAAILLAAALARSTANTRAARRDRDNAETEARAIEADRDTLAMTLAETEDERNEALFELTGARQTIAAMGERNALLPLAPFPGEPLRTDLGAMDPPPDYITLQAAVERKVAPKRNPRAVKAVKP